MITTSNGTVCYDADFYPFGGERTITDTCPQNYKFEGKERDTETGNDDFGARYYSSNLGRWLSPDWSAVPAPIPYADITNPQSLNLYSMVRNNPETFADIAGHLAGVSGEGPIGNTASIVEMENQGELEQKAQEEKNKPQPSTPAPQDHHAEPQNPPQGTDQSKAATIGAAVGAVSGAVVGAVVGAVSGATVGTAVEPGGGTVVVGILGGAQGAQTGAEIGAAAGAAAGALAPVVYTKGKDAAAKIGSQLERALDHLAKLNGPDQNPNPRRGWRQSVRDAANQIDKQADRIPNTKFRNAAHFVADRLRERVGPE